MGFGGTDLYLGGGGRGLGVGSGRRSSVESVVSLGRQRRGPGGSPNPEEHHPLQHSGATPVAELHLELRYSWSYATPVAELHLELRYNCSYFKPVVELHLKLCYS